MWRRGGDGEGKRGARVGLETGSFAESTLTGEVGRARLGRGCGVCETARQRRWRRGGGSLSKRSCAYFIGFLGEQSSQNQEVLAKQARSEHMYLSASCHPDGSLFCIFSKVGRDGDKR